MARPLPGNFGFPYNIRCPSTAGEMSIRFALATAAVFVGSVLATEVKADDIGNCSNATLHSSYGLHATETVINVGRFAAVGRSTFEVLFQQHNKG
jgi:hypothetical protein